MCQERGEITEMRWKMWMILHQIKMTDVLLPLAAAFTVIDHHILVLN